MVPLLNPSPRLPARTRCARTLGRREVKKRRRSHRFFGQNPVLFAVRTEFCEALSAKVPELNKKAFRLGQNA